METSTQNITIFVDSARIILTLPTVINKNEFPLWSYFSKIKSYIKGNSTKIGPKAIIPFFSRKKDSKSFNKKGQQNLWPLSVASPNKYKEISNTLNKKLKIMPLI